MDTCKKMDDSPIIMQKRPDPKHNILHVSIFITVFQSQYFRGKKVNQWLPESGVKEEVDYKGAPGNLGC